MKLVFSGGGTAGHIFPGIAAARSAVRKFPGSEVLFITGGRPVDPDLFGGLRVKHIKCGSVMGARGLKLARSLLSCSGGILESALILKRFNPDVIIGAGGYASAPVIAAGLLSGRKVLLLEQNYFPGLTTRIFSRFAAEVELSFPGSEKFLPRGARFCVTGNPVREEIVRASRSGAYSVLGLSPEKFTLAVFGGSSGAVRINTAMEEFLKKPAARGVPAETAASWQVVHITGEGSHASLGDAYSRAGFDARILPFIRGMGHVYACADLIVARSGGNTVAEAACRGVAALYVPYPHAANNHQELNARWVRDRGGCVIVPDCRLMTEEFRGALLGLMQNRAARRRLAAGAQKTGRPDASSRVAERIGECSGM